MGEQHAKGGGHNFVTIQPLLRFHMVTYKAVQYMRQPSLLAHSYPAFSMVTYKAVQYMRQQPWFCILPLFTPAALLGAIYTQLFYCRV